MAHPELLQSFLQEAEEVMLQLESGVQALCADGRTGTEPATAPALGGMAQVSLLAHRMRGSAGLYGFQQLSTLAGLLERLLDARPELRGEHAGAYLALLEEISGALRGGLRTLQAGGTDRDLGLTFARSAAPARLQALVTAVPDAFRMRAALHRAPDPEDAAEPGAEGLEARLRAFVTQNEEVWEYFAPEVHEHVAALRHELDHPDAADANVMFRSAHTIKGSSYMVGLTEVGDFAHGLEDLLGAVRSDTVALNAPALSALAGAVDLLDDMMLVAGGGHVLQDGAVTLQGRLESLSAQLQRLAAGEAPAAAAVPTAAPQARAAAAATIRVPAQRLEGLMDQLGEVVGSRARLSALLARLDEMQGLMQDSQARFQRTVRDFEERYLNPDMVRTLDAGRGAATPDVAGQGLTAAFADLEFDTYDDLNILSRSITELSVDFGEVRKRLTDTVSGLQEENEALGKLIRQLRTDLNATSRVPFSQATARLRRWAREQPHLTLAVEGDDVLVESGILQRLTEPMLHLLTNAAHHGLRRAAEDPQGRVAQGKPATGQVFIRASESANFLEVTVADDGDGLDLDRIRERALGAGVGSAQELAAMGDAEAARLILLPGLSTAETVGQTAGRGVGMDVVANSVRALGGELLIQSEPGVGTAFVLRLPTTQRIMDVLDVQLGAQDAGAFAVNTVQALRDVPEADITLIEGAPHVRFEGQLVPVVDARPFWGPVAGDEVGAAAHLVFASSISGTIAVRVRAFGRIEEVSVTPPSPLLGRLEYLAGLTVGATGAVLPLLDPAGLLRLARRPDAWLSGAAAQAGGTGRTLLLVDDSVSVRRLVSRMLERAGFTVLTANDGQEGLDLIHSGEHLDAVITDLEMPRMNGYELLGAVRARPDSAELPVLVMTTRAGEKHQQLAFSLGATDYFTKPVNETLLLRRLQALLGQAGVDAAPAPGAVPA